MAMGCCEVPSIKTSNEEYLTVLSRVLNDLDTSGLADMRLLGEHSAVSERYRANADSCKRNTLLYELALLTDNFLGIVIRSMRQDGATTLPMRKRINKLMLELTDGAYQPIWQP